MIRSIYFFVYWSVLVLVCILIFTNYSYGQQYYPVVQWGPVQNTYLYGNVHIDRNRRYVRIGVNSGIQNFTQQRTYGNYWFDSNLRRFNYYKSRSLMKFEKNYPQQNF